MSKSPFKMPGFSGFGNIKPLSKLGNTEPDVTSTTELPNPNASIEEKITAKTDEKINEKVDEKIAEVVNQKSGNGLNV